jgi:hypothetical protein
MHQAHDLCSQQSATTRAHAAAGRTLTVKTTTWLSVEEVRVAVLAASAPCARRDLLWMSRDRNAMLNLTTLPPRTTTHQRESREC